MNEITLDQALDTVMQFPPEQQEMLIEIIRTYPHPKVHLGITFRASYLSRFLSERG
jgi:hypothetical protein